MPKTKQKELSFIDHRLAVQKLPKTDKAELRQLLQLLFGQKRFLIQLERCKIGQKLWRVVDLPTRGRTPDDFSYPPQSEHCGIGRCNKAGQQVFYASTSLGICLSEMKSMEIGKKVRAGIWEVKKEFYYLDTTKQDNPDKKSAKVHKALSDLYDHIGDEHYPQTSEVTDWIMTELSHQMSTAVLRDGGSLEGGIQAVRYPSTLRSEDADTFSNFAFSKGFVDGLGLDLARWYHLEVRETGENSCTVQSEYFGSRSWQGVSDTGKLNWSSGPTETFAVIPPGASVKFVRDGTRCSVPAFGGLDLV